VEGQPRRNDDRFYRYPSHRVVAIVDHAADVDEAVSELQQIGVDTAHVDVLSGPEGARLLDRTGRRHGLRARLLRWAQRGAYEGETLRAHEHALNDGKHVIYVPVRGEEERTQVARILRAAGGSSLLYFRGWSIEEMPGGV
jgi:hypothetical protein